MRPLFVPLRACHFDAFRSGVKRIEWRAYGAHWNRQTAHRGRPVTLSLGYSGPRLSGVVVRARKVRAALAPLIAREIYPDAVYLCSIHVALSEGIASKARA